MTLPSMNCRMTRPTQRLQIIKRVVPPIFRSSHPTAVNVMNVQIILAAAILTCVIVALQGGDPVAAEAVVVFGLLAILAHLVRISCAPIADNSNSSPVCAIGAADLRPGAVFKARAAILAPDDVALGGCSTRITLGPAVFGALYSRKLFGAIRASLLVAACGLVDAAANYARLFRKATPRLAVGFQRARLTPLPVWGCLGDSLAAIRAGKKTVFRHVNSGLVEPRHANARAV